MIARSSSDIAKFSSEEFNRGFFLGENFMRFAILRSCFKREEEKRMFVWTIHHSIYDEWSLNYILQDTLEYYCTKKCNSKNFIQGVH